MPDSQVGAGPDIPEGGRADPGADRAGLGAALPGMGHPADTEPRGSRVAAGSRPAPRRELAACRAGLADRPGASPAGLPGPALQGTGRVAAPAAAARVAAGLVPAGLVPAGCTSGRPGRSAAA